MIRGIARWVAVGIVASLVTGCGGETGGSGTVNDGSGRGIAESKFGETSDDRDVTLWTLVNANGLRASLIDYGAILVSLETPDRDGNMADIVLGCRDVERNGHHFGGGLQGYDDLEKARFLAAHPDLYRRNDGRIDLRIEDGTVAIGSLFGPGFGR